MGRSYKYFAVFLVLMPKYIAKNIYELFLSQVSFIFNP
jgi:hypothetical protein